VRRRNRTKFCEISPKVPNTFSFKSLPSPALVVPLTSVAAMDDNLYDEFGVYIGPDLDDEDAFSDHDQGTFESGQQGDLAGDARMDLGMLPSSAFSPSPSLSCVFSAFHCLW